MPSSWKVLTLCPQFLTSILQLPCAEEESQMMDNAIFEGQRNSFAPMTMSRNLFQCTQTWGQTHHRLGISQALGQLSSKCFWQNQGQWAGYRAHHGRKKGLQHLFHLQTYLLNDLIAQEEILPSLHTHWDLCSWGEENRKQLQERQMCKITFFSGATVCWYWEYSEIKEIVCVDIWSI